jgi:hypothetical protein
MTRDRHMMMANLVNRDVAHGDFSPQISSAAPAAVGAPYCTCHATAHFWAKAISIDATN